MGLIQNILLTAVGRKTVMALTGLCLCSFLLVHLSGNLNLFAGKVAFNFYVDRLHSLGVVIPVFELILLALALTHVATGFALFIKNVSSRSVSYRKTKPVRWRLISGKNGKTVGSSTMPCTGILLLSFILLHLTTLKFADHTGTTTFDLVKRVFGMGSYVAIYLVAMAVAAIHVSHGFWSAFRSLGIDREKLTPVLKKMALLFSAAVGFGFGSIPLYLWLK